MDELAGKQPRNSGAKACDRLRLRLAPHEGALREGVTAAYDGPIYEAELDRDPRWALSEGSRFFEGKSAVQEALAKITKRLNELGISYRVAGDMALFHHEYRRFTEDVHLLVSREGLREIHSKLSGLGYLPPFSHSKNLRDTDLGVRVEFIVTGDYPGDGKPKPVAFPDPTVAGVDYGGIKYLSLPRFVELKLASGMTDQGRMRDLSDVIELIKLLNLPSEFGAQLDPFVQSKYLELWNKSQRRYVMRWRNKWLTAEATSIDDMIASLRETADLLAAMQNDGVTLDPKGGAADDYVYLVTTDAHVAKKYDMHDEKEFWNEDDDVYEDEDADKDREHQPY
jgi:hypothetical protein